MPKILIIIPAYNEEENLKNVLEKLTLYKGKYDVIVIDDASTDQTVLVAQSLRFPVVRLAANLGIGGAVQTGFKYAVNHNYDVAVQLDGDGQHDPACIDSIINPILKNDVDCAIGSRYVNSDRDCAYKTPFFRRVGMRFSSLLLYLATGNMITDTTSGFRALNRRAFMYFAREYPVDHPEAEALFLLHVAGFKITEVPVKMFNRQTGKSYFNFFRASIYPFRVLVGFLGILLRRL